MDHKVKDNWKDAYIDPEIYNLVLALNRDDLSIRTIACCAGHVRGMAEPYVYFKSPVPVAAGIAKAMLSYELSGKMKYAWQLQGCFNEKFELCFAIKSAPLARVKYSTFQTFIAFVLQRKRINDDLELLAQMVHEVLNKIGNGGGGKNCNLNQEKNN